LSGKNKNDVLVTLSKVMNKKEGVFPLIKNEGLEGKTEKKKILKYGK